MSQPFAHLHVHSAYSLARSAIRADDLAKYSVANNMPAIGITDTNSLSGVYTVSKALSGAGVQAIPGIELNLRLRDDLIAPIVLLAKNDNGYLNLMHIASAAALVHPERPQTELKRLLSKSDDLLILSGGWNGPFDTLIRSGQIDDADRLAQILTTGYGDRFYMELQRYGRGDETEVLDALLEIAEKHQIGSVATVDAYYLTPDMYDAHDALTCIATGGYVEDPKRQRLPMGHHLRSGDEMRRLFADMPDAVEASLDIAQRCSFHPPKAKPFLPRFPDLGDQTEDEKIARMASDGLETRLSFGLAEGFSRQDYLDRLSFELATIQKMGFSGYFLIVQDFINWAKQNDIAVGPGRGSGAGSLVAYSLGITDLDPLKYGLLFERFLNPDRVSMPDFDIDFEQENREKVIDYVKQRYGRDRVAQIGTIGKLQARAVLRDTGRVLGVGYGQVDRLARMIPSNPAHPVTLEEALDMPDLRAEVERSDARVKKMFDIARKLEGLFRHSSTHAAGVVISDKSLLSTTPVLKDDNGNVVTMLDMKAVEETGLVKFDFLGLKTLDVIKQTERLCSSEVTFDWRAMGTDDPETYRMLQQGESYGVFQLESVGMQDAMRRVKPTRIDDLVALVSLYRPGPMENIPVYADVKHKLKQPAYPHPILADVLNETHGVIVYQEQVMEIARRMSGYSLAQADLLRRAMGKKIASEMAAQKDGFIAGAVKNGIDEASAGKVFELVAKFAEYGFNKSHAAAYAELSYRTAYLKRHHTAEFMVANLNIERSNVDKIAEFIVDARSSSLKILPPDVNHSEVLFSIEILQDLRLTATKAVRYGLAGIRHCGETAMQDLVNERSENGPFKDLRDFVKRTAGKVNKSALESLGRSGALDCFGDRGAVLDALPGEMERAKSDNRKGADQMSMFGEPPFTLPKVPSPSPVDILMWEVDTMGVCVSEKPVRGWNASARRENTIPIANLRAQADSGTKSVAISGVLSRFEQKMTKAKKPFSVLVLADPTGQVEVLMFNEVNELHRGRIAKGNAYKVEVDVSVRDDRTSLFVRNIEPMFQEVSKDETISAAPEGRLPRGGVASMGAAEGGGLADTPFPDARGQAAPRKHASVVQTQHQP